MTVRSASRSLLWGRRGRVVVAVAVAAAVPGQLGGSARAAAAAQAPAAAAAPAVPAGPVTWDTTRTVLARNGS